MIHATIAHRGGVSPLHPSQLYSPAGAEDFAFCFSPFIPQCLPPILGMFTRYSSPSACSQPDSLTTTFIMCAQGKVSPSHIAHGYSHSVSCTFGVRHFQMVFTHRFFTYEKILFFTFPNVSLNNVGKCFLLLYHYTLTYMYIYIKENSSKSKQTPFSQNTICHIGISKE